MGRRRPDEASMRVHATRVKVVFYVFFAFAIYVAVRFYVVQVHDGPMLAARAHKQRLSELDFPAHRGAIFDRYGVALARSLPSQSIYATPSEVEGVDRTAAKLASVLHGVPAADIATSLHSSGDYVEVVHKITYDEAVAIGELKLPGISVVAETTGVRFVPSGTLAASVIGFTGFDDNGLEGAESAFDDVLRGTPGKMVLETDHYYGSALPFDQPRVVVAARAGHSIALTIDSYMQYNVRRVLLDTVKRWHAESGCAIVMDPSTGEVLALASAPDYDVREYARYSPDVRRDRCVTDVYEPGSTFKLITAAAAIDSGKVTPEDRFPSRDEMQIGGATIHNAEDGFLAGSSGSETLEDIIAYSHNVGAAEVGLRIGRQTMYDEIERFGFDEPTNVGLPGENAGLVPRLKDWSDTSLPTMSFGHGIAVTPLALARAYAAIANGGILMRPRILSAIIDSDGRETYRYGPEIERRVMSPETAATLRRFLRAVVVRGTGNPTAQVPGYTTAGKTGTAQVVENGVYAPGEYIASFVGFVPAESARYVILVKITKPRGAIYGSVIAAPAFAEIAKMAMMRAGILPAGPRLVRLGTSSKRSL
jgi:cell division protein FtsI/penicillin-binding protein 2